MRRLWFIALLCLGGCGTAPQPTPIAIPLASSPRNVIVDTDVSVDDILALLYLLSRPDVNVQAITIVGTGITRCETGIRNVRAILEVVEQTNIPIACGRETPLHGDHAFPNEWRDAAENFFGVNVQPAQFVMPNEDAVTLFNRTLESSNEQMIVVALGPLTNIAVAFGLPDFWDTPLGALLNYLLGLTIPTLLPLAFGVAMLRDQLWQSERVLNRAFVYFALTAILLGVYIFIIGALSEIFRATNNFLIAAIATGVVALLFQPLRERLQRGINRFLYGQRDEPFTVLNQLGAQLENSITPDTALPLIVETIGKTLRVPYVAIALSDEERGLRTEWGNKTQSSVLITFDLKYQNEIVGKLMIARRAPNENFSTADLQLLENLARQAGAVAYTARLNAELQQSREKIIAERENERKRLRRDLHDGLGPTLASQTLKLDAAIELLNDENQETKEARKILQDVKAQTQNTVADIRRIVYELRPPALDDLGLVGALRAHLAQYNTVNGLQITFDTPNELPPLSAAVQLNAYRIVLEAVNNVVRHANATHCIVRIASGDSRLETRDLSLAKSKDLRLEIGDNGVGLSENFRAGVGVTSMRERAEELGGTFRIEQNAPSGTRVIAALPIENQKSKISIL